MVTTSRRVRSRIAIFRYVCLWLEKERRRKRKNERKKERKKKKLVLLQTFQISRRGLSLVHWCRLIVKMRLAVKAGKEE